MKYTEGTRVLHTASNGGWYASKRIKRTGTVVKDIGGERVSIQWDDGKRSSVDRDGLTLIQVTSSEKIA